MELVESGCGEHERLGGFVVDWQGCGQRRLRNEVDEECETGNAREVGVVLW